VTGTATYLYAITRPVPQADLAGLRGVGDEPVRAVGVGGLSCLVSTVDLAAFGEEPLRANLEDLGWLERTARQHDDVVRAAARVTTTVPLRLATICANDAAACDRLAELGSKASAVLDELDGRDEWGVKLFAVDRAAPSAAEEAGPAAESSGAAYLRRRREQLERRNAQSEVATQEAERLYRELERRAVRAHRHRPQDQRLSGATAPMLLNAAYLVDRERVDEFRRAVDDLAGERPPDSIVVTGPWPPYSFATVEER
jgi:hypothetical protein